MVHFSILKFCLFVVFQISASFMLILKYMNNTEVGSIKSYTWLVCVKSVLVKYYKRVWKFCLKVLSYWNDLR